MITKTGNFFHLEGKNISYVIAIGSDGTLVHSYYGKKIRVNENYKTSFNTLGNTLVCADDGVYERYMPEYSDYGYCDLHTPAYRVKNSDGNSISNPLYKDYIIKDGVSEIKGMPSVIKGNANAKTLEITLADEVTGLEIILCYTVFDEYNVIARNVKFVNTSDKKLELKSAYSSTLELRSGSHDLIYFPGSWARERNFTRIHITEGMENNVSNMRGPSGHNMNPFVMIADSDATENSGNVYSMSLVYSGNHSTCVMSDNNKNIRILQGINPFGFDWELNGGDEFETPQSIMCFSDCGIGGISRELADLVRSNLCRSTWTYKERPVLINNWEGTYFDFNEEKLLAIAKRAKEAGVELFVLDDGWFGKRDNDDCSLGDWIPDKRKLPNGIDGLADKINALGMSFGLWFEPEMISPDSDLYRAHPDWAISVPGRTPIQKRNQYILDLSRDDVCEYAIEAVSKILASANISYVKWDMNRQMTDMPCDSYNHKYILGFYKIMSAITERFPNILFEGCAGGGGRFDMGVLAYMPQIWTSDNSDAASRLKIQYSTSMGYPTSAMGAHVTASPNHQNGRITPLKTRANVAYSGTFGYELDITKVSDEEFEEIKEQIVRFKELRKFIPYGDLYRVENPYDSNLCTWEIVSKDKSEAFVMSCRILSQIGYEAVLRLTGLDADADYLDKESGIVYGGDELMYKGIERVFDKNDFASFVMHLVKQK